MGNNNSTPPSSPKFSQSSRLPTDHDLGVSLKEIFQRLSGPERELIKTVSLGLYELLIENFHSLVHLFYYMSSPEVDGPGSEHVTNIPDLRMEGEFITWLGSIRQTVSELKKTLRRSRLSILELVTLHKEGDFQHKKNIYNTL